MSNVAEQRAKHTFHPLLAGQGRADPLYLDEPYASPWPGCVIGFPPGGSAMASLLPGALDQTSRTPILELHVDRLEGNAWTTMEFDITPALPPLIDATTELALVGRVRSIPHYDMHVNLYAKVGEEGRTIQCGVWRSTHRFQPFEIQLPAEEILNAVAGAAGQAAVEAPGDGLSAGSLRIGITGMGGTWFTVQLSDLGILARQAR